MKIKFKQADSDELLELERKRKSERDALLVYLIAKFENEDWHGVQDAASDLRDIDSELNTLHLVLKRR